MKFGITMHMHVISKSWYLLKFIKTRPNIVSCPLGVIQVNIRIGEKENFIVLSLYPCLTFEWPVILFQNQPPLPPGDDYGMNPPPMPPGDHNPPLPPLPPPPMEDPRYEGQHSFNNQFNNQYHHDQVRNNLDSSTIYQVSSGYAPRGL